jgi:hypothetical protein
VLGGRLAQGTFGWVHSDTECNPSECTFFFCFFSLIPIAPLNQLSKAERQQITLPENLKEILVGLLLGDLYACKQSVNVHLQFKQGVTIRFTCFICMNYFKIIV